MRGFVMGTRPEIIKMAPIMRLLDMEGLPYLIFWTQQHTRSDMAMDFFEELGLRTPDVVLTGGMVNWTQGKLGVHLTANRIDMLLVEGDTDSVLFGALAAVRAGIPVCHVEAGLRSGDLTMPEEKNRIAVDHMSTILCAPTSRAKDNLELEGVKGDIHFTGNTIVDALHLYTEKGDPPFPEHYFMATLHRRENVDNPERLTMLLDALENLGETMNAKVVLPIHPRTAERVKGMNRLRRFVKFVDPLGYLAFVNMLYHADAVLTDSGGVQEEAAVMGVPCVTLRTTTERQETIDAGVNMLANSPEEILEAARRMMQVRSGLMNPYGDGHAAERILEVTK